MGTRSALRAVLTADIVNSTQLTPAVELALVEELKRALAPNPVEFYRGDSFQVYMKNPAGSLQAALLCRVLAISLTAGEDEPVASDIRISIGLGPVVSPVRRPGTAKGEAFLLSGRQFDKMEEAEQRLMMIASGEPVANVGLQVMADYLESIYKGMTVKQAGVLVGLLQGETQSGMVAKLNKSKSTISQLANAGRWSEIEKILLQFEHLINLLL